MEQLSTKVGGMKGPWRRACEVMLNEIEMSGKIPKGFFALSPEQQHAEFKKLDFEAQYSTYILGMRVPGESDFLPSAFASEGSKIVQPLTQKLQSAENEMTIRDTILVFGAMSRSGTYDVAADKPLMEKLRAKVASMKDWKDVCEKQLNEISAHSGKPNPPSSPPSQAAS